MAELNDAPVASLLADESGRPSTIVLRGELDTVSADGARSVVDQALEAGNEQLVFEMAELGFMDSSGIAVLVLAANRVSSVVLRNPSEMIRRVIEITGLAELFRIEP